MAKKSLRDLHELAGRRALIRVDFNVPLGDGGEIVNDRRIRAALPTIGHVLAHGGSAIVMSHLGRPRGDPARDVHLRMDRVAERLRHLLAAPVAKTDEVVGPAASAAAAQLPQGGVLVLENLRFHPGEQAGDAEFAAKLAALGDLYVNDAFGTCHRTDASMYALPQAMTGKPRVVGFLVAKELEVLDQLLTSPRRPLVALLGGAKVSDKIGFIRSMLSRVDRLLIGGAMTYTFMMALGQAIGSSRSEADKLDVARELLAQGGDKIVLPVDHLVAERPDADAPVRVVDGGIPQGWLGMDIGPKTIAAFAQIVAGAGTAVWNGPMGKYEDEPFSRGTRAMAEALACCPGVTIVGGGETADAVESFGLDSKMSHVSTGGGAFLEYLEGTPFRALQVLDDL